MRGLLIPLVLVLSLHASSELRVLSGGRYGAVHTAAEHNPLTPAKDWMASGRKSMLSRGRFGDFRTILTGSTEPPGKFVIELSFYSRLGRPARCMALEANPSDELLNIKCFGPPDPKDLCPVSVETMVGWIEDTVRDKAYTLHLTDRAQGSCQYRGKARRKRGNPPVAYYPTSYTWQMVRDAHFLLTPMSFIKYGQPYYTRSAGMLPENLVLQSSEHLRTQHWADFCRGSRLAKALGNTPVSQVLHAVAPDMGEHLKAALAMMNNGAGPTSNVTLRDLLVDRSVWRAVRADVSECRALSKVSGMLNLWPCEGVAGERAEQCVEHQKLANWMGNIAQHSVFVRQIDERVNIELTCDSYGFGES